MKNKKKPIPVLNDEFIVKIADRVQTIKLGVSTLGNLIVLDRLPATVTSLGVVKALWRLQCILCQHNIVRDLTNGKIPRCNCINRISSNKKLELVILEVLGARTNQITAFREIKLLTNSKNEAVLRATLKKLITSGRIKTARDDRYRGYRLILRAGKPLKKLEREEETQLMPVVDDCSYE